MAGRSRPVRADRLVAGHPGAFRRRALCGSVGDGAPAAGLVRPGARGLPGRQQPLRPLCRVESRQLPRPAVLPDRHRAADDPVGPAVRLDRRLCRLHADGGASGFRGLAPASRHHLRARAVGAVRADVVDGPRHPDPSGRCAVKPDAGRDHPSVDRRGLGAFPVGHPSGPVSADLRHRLPEQAVDSAADHSRGPGRSRGRVRADRRLPVCQLGHGVRRSSDRLLLHDPDVPPAAGGAPAGSGPSDRVLPADVARRRGRRCVHRPDRSDRVQHGLGVPAGSGPGRSRPSLGQGAHREGRDHRAGCRRSGGAVSGPAVGLAERQRRSAGGLLRDVPGRHRTGGDGHADPGRDLRLPDPGPCARLHRRPADDRSIGPMDRTGL